MRCYKESTDELDRIFNLVKTRLIDEHHRSKEELTKFLEKEIEVLEKQEKELHVDIEINSKEKARVVALLEKVEREKRAEEEFAI